MHVNWFKQYRQIIMLIVHFAGVLPEKHDRLGILDHTLATENLLESLLTRCSLRTRENKYETHKAIHCCLPEQKLSQSPRLRSMTPSG